jgi:hypothetical protein
MRIKQKKRKKIKTITKEDRKIINKSSVLLSGIHACIFQKTITP